MQFYETQHRIEIASAIFPSPIHGPFSLRTCFTLLPLIYSVISCLQAAVLDLENGPKGGLKLRKATRNEKSVRRCVATRLLCIQQLQIFLNYAGYKNMNRSGRPMKTSTRDNRTI